MTNWHSGDIKRCLHTGHVSESQWQNDLGLWKSCHYPRTGDDEWPYKEQIIIWYFSSIFLLEGKQSIYLPCRNLPRDGFSSTSLFPDGGGGEGYFLSYSCKLCNDLGTEWNLLLHNRHPSLVRFLIWFLWFSVILWDPGNWHHSDLAYTVRISNKTVTVHLALLCPSRLNLWICDKPNHKLTLYCCFRSSWWLIILLNEGEKKSSLLCLVFNRGV